MERLDFRKKFIGLFGKYKYAAIILCIGILMMLLPESVSKDEQHEIPVQQSKSMSPTADLENTPDSVFCEHGAGVNVKWN